MLLIVVMVLSVDNRRANPYSEPDQNRALYTFGMLASVGLSQKDCAVALLFKTGPVEQVDWANPIAGCSGYYDRISPA
jgi:hypothetical protein